MNKTYAALPLRDLNNPKEFAQNHFATMKAAMREGGAEIPGYQPREHEPKDKFIKNFKTHYSNFPRPHMALNRNELQLSCMTAGSEALKSEYLQIDARVKPGVWKSEMITVSHVAGKGPLITKIVMPRPWSISRMEIHQVKLPADPCLPPTYSKRVGPDFKLVESSPDQQNYPRQEAWALLDAAREMDPLLRIPGRTLDSLAANFDQALGGVKAPYWDGQIK